MGLFHNLNERARTQGLPFLVIGGLAVNWYGYSRETADLDLLISLDARDAWLTLFSELGYSHFSGGGAFVQLSPPTGGEWPVDLMLVREPTFRPMLDEAKEVEIYGERLLVPALNHLLALKLHALKHTQNGVAHSNHYCGCQIRAAFALAAPENSRF
jgi:hypothetical protein